jgi:hypothetical protein
VASLIVVEDLVGSAVLGRGGHAIIVLHFLEALRRLGHDVVFVEFISEPPDSAQSAYWSQVINGRWSADRAALLNSESGESYAGLARGAVARQAERSSAVISLAAQYRARPWPVIGDVRPRIGIDKDPAYTQLWAAEAVTPAEIYGEHDFYFTVGLNVGTSKSKIPTLGLQWHPIMQPVVLDWWSGDWPVARDRFTTVGAWRDYGYLEFEGQLLGPKVEEFERFIGLPALAGEPIELTLAIDPEDPDLERLRRHGWLVQNPSLVYSAEDFRSYVAGSLAEFSCAKGGYVGTHSGWFSDRSACYLAAGRPVVVQATGIEDVLPVGEGLFSVRSVEEAADAMRAIRGDYPIHSRAARAIATEYLDAQRIVAGMLETCGIGAAGEARSVASMDPTGAPRG